MAIHVRGTVLPGGERAEFWIDGDRLRHAPVPGAETVADGQWLLPGLADAHTHPGRGGLGTPLDDLKLGADLRAHAEAGVALIRAAGSPDRPLPRAPGIAAAPRIVDAGVPLGVPGQFPPDAGRIVEPAELPEAAVQHCRDAGDGWCKIYADWIVDDETLAEPPITPADALAEAVRRVHAAGGRVAVHALHRDACRAAVDAGADSLEHGMWLESRLLPRMAASGMALTPTITVWERQREAIMAAAGPLRDFFLGGIERLPRLAAAAHAAGVTVLAGTDSEPHGRVAEEIRRLAAGPGAMSPEAALGAGSWAARRFLGVAADGLLADGGPADLVSYDRDPRQDLSVLDNPGRVIIGGRVLR